MTKKTVNSHQTIAVFAALTALVTCLAMPAYSAGKKRAAAPWFELEVILFSYDRNPSNVQERFPFDASPLPVGRKIELLNDFHYQPTQDLRQQLPTCSNENHFGHYYKTRANNLNLPPAVSSHNLPSFKLYYSDSINETESNTSQNLPVKNTASAIANPESTNAVSTNFDNSRLPSEPIYENRENSDSSLAESQANSVENNLDAAIEFLPSDNGNNSAPVVTRKQFESTGEINFLAIQRELNQLYITLTNFNRVDGTNRDNMSSGLSSQPVENSTADTIRDIPTFSPNQAEFELPIDLDSYNRAKALAVIKTQAKPQLTCNQYPANPFSLFDEPLPVTGYDYAELPRHIDASSQRNEQRPHLLTTAELTLNDVYQTLRKQPDIRPILHTGWRQRGYQERSAIPVHLYAGIRYQALFDEQGLARVVPSWKAQIAPVDLNTAANLLPTPSEKTNEDDVQNNIQKLLLQLSSEAISSNNTANEVPQQKLPSTWKSDNPLWEIDGLFKIFMRGRYLHFDANFNVRRPSNIPVALQETFKQSISPQHWEALQQVTSDQQYLHNYQFAQKRRVITTEVHYFDHPFMGIVVQARRWGW